MCGRYAQFKRRKDYERYLKVQAAKGAVEERPSWNIAPSTKPEYHAVGEVRGD
jgi:putative SOS response-associated peptidase YedK